MEGLPQIIALDTKAAAQAFKASDFDNMNVFANRSMANAIMGKDKKLILPGFFMKEVAAIFGVIKADRTSALSTAKVVGDKYLASLEKTIEQGKYDEKELWGLFYGLNRDLKEFLKDDSEKNAYKSDDPKFSHYSFVWLLGYLKEKKAALVNPKNLLLKGVINEMDRIFKVHGGSESEIYAISMLKALDRYYDYFSYAYNVDGMIEEEKVKSTIFPYVDQITDMFSSGKGIDISRMTEILWELVSGWRKFFIEFFELRRPTMPVEKAIVLPEEVKRRLTESITKALEKEVKAT